MCGIAGIVGYRSNDLDNIDLMIDRLKHRGPDNKGKWLSEDEGIALGHTRLAIVDVSDAGLQPMVSRSEQFVISFNGEIYNSLEYACSHRISM